jgi:hypothetical protein
LQWPAGDRERREAFEAWHYQAMHLINREKASFQLLAIVWRFIDWRTGTFWASNSVLAGHAGGCSEKTVTRNIEQLRRLGLVLVDLGFAKRKDGKLYRTRTVRLALPNDLNALEELPDDENHLDHGCPDDHGSGDLNHLDHGCPKHRDHGCPISLEYTPERRKP